MDIITYVVNRCIPLMSYTFFCVCIDVVAVTGSYYVALAGMKLAK